MSPARSSNSHRKKSASIRFKEDKRKQQVERIGTRDQALLTELQKLSEYDLTIQVLKPLLLATGYIKVEYHGGVNEGGKDIICWEENRLGDPEITVVQVKKYRPTSRAADRRSFSEIVSQLSQAAEKSIPTLEMGKVIPSRILFITPLPIDTRALESRFEGYEALRTRNLRVIDGTKLALLLRRHLPLLVSRLIGAEFDIAEVMRTQLNNDPLMNALGAKGSRDIRTFYTDIDFLMGRRTTTQFFTTQFSPNHRDFVVSHDKWKRIARANRFCNDMLHIQILTEPEETIDRRHASLIEDYRTWETQTNHFRETLKTHGHHISEIQGDLNNIVNRLRRMEVDRIPRIRELEDNIHKDDEAVKAAALQLEHARRSSSSCDGKQKTLDLIEQALRSYKNKLSSLQQYDSNDLGNLSVIISDLITELERDKDITDNRNNIEEWLRVHDREVVAMELDTLQGFGCIRNLVSDFLTTADKCVVAKKELARFPPQPPLPLITFALDGSVLASYLDSQQSSILLRIKQFRTNQPDRSALRTFLSDCNSVLHAVDNILRVDEIASVVGVLQTTSIPNDPKAYRITVPIHRVLDTGVNLTILGEAGAGKTTSLQMYALDKLDSGPTGDICIFVSLGRLPTAPQIDAMSSPSQNTPRLEAYIANYLTGLGVAVTDVDLIRLFETRRVVLLLDGIDEGITKMPSLLEAIASLAERFPKTHIVTSSRIMGRYVARIPFLMVTLLPFSDQQQAEFFDRWFATPEDERRLRIARHLGRNKRVAEIVRSPLLATILCVLAEHDIDLPESEIQLYQERMRLLVGHYDLHKQITRRIHTRPDDLMLLARKLAFQLHFAETRQMTPDRICNVVVNSMESRPIPGKHLDAVNDLVDPCNVLLPMTNDGQLGFGHLRYQEFLAAEEIKTNRAIDICPLLSSTWWRSVFVLVARMVEDLDWLMEMISYRDLPRSSLRTVDAMIAVRSVSERRSLKIAVKSAYEDRRCSEMFLDAFGD